MIPLKDENPIQITPVCTVGLILLNVLVFLYELSLGNRVDQFVLLYGAIPHTLLHGEGSRSLAAIPPSLTVLTSMFLHGGLLHVAGNMLYLWIFGNNIEDVLGHVRFLLFYVISGYAAAYAHALSESNSMMPMIGASGAISGVLGAYLVLFPKVRVLTLVPFGFFIQAVRIPAVVVLGFWFVIQFINGTASLRAVSLGRVGEGVAWFAHIGGFVAGMILILIFPRRKPARYRWG